MKKKTTCGIRPRNEYIKVFVTEDERAVQAGMSHSAFLRAVGLHEPILTVVDLLAVAEAPDVGLIGG
ncbi:hypothetical protein [Pseudomonas sp.]|uniref:hypothetical protein n=1 Tax=Pseudomonas sp. TaxID=306 RepID=UPI0028A6726B|nr:hypothetical protein [Pseudomonas sp.]